MTPFRTIRQRAAKRKGGPGKLAEQLPAVPGNKALASLPDDRILAEMARRIFSSGFAWRVIEQKWPGFEEAFLHFDVQRLNFEPDEFWERLASDKRIVRNHQKITAVRQNAHYVAQVAKEHGSFGAFLASWPANDQLGLLDHLAKHGSRLGGRTGEYFLRFVGWDAWIASRDVLLCLRDAGLDIAEQPTSRKDRRKIADQLNAWQVEAKLPMTHISRICAMSIGDNYDSATLAAGAEE